MNVDFEAKHNFCDQNQCKSKFKTFCVINIFTLQTDNATYQSIRGFSLNCASDQCCRSTRSLRFSTKMIIFYLIICVLSVLYLWTKYVYSYWERLGFPYIKPSIPLGNLSESCIGSKSIGMELFTLINKLAFLNIFLMAE